MDSFMQAAQNRSIRSIKTELDFLLDSSLLTSQQVSSILAILPEAATNSTTSRAQAVTQPIPLPAPTTNGFSNNHFSEKQSQPTPSPSPAPHAPPPPSYNAGPAVIATASALYAYAPADAGDLALQPHDRVQILENMNADWARGRNERTGDEGIFPRSYVSIVEDKPGPPSLPFRTTGQPMPGMGMQPQQNGGGYGNMPVDVANQPAQQNGEPSKVEQQGKKFGKKLGNAAIFGAGATIGSNLVNSIF